MLSYQGRRRDSKGFLAMLKERNGIRHLRADALIELISARTRTQSYDCPVESHVRLRQVHGPNALFSSLLKAQKSPFDASE